ncbi:hypothetical protein F8O01_11535 [Pseudoclavibacter chungangensis]|uniref:Uncharacterized protein n=1 Tax=Pseudoclavibacter chungangensis TaxID=587635 RepID=A0A7J5BQ04_9MICO|nr:hypothetical protein [Pseudoclavibacter chungangensis]KAB1655630.1 hypothetical protein F8O01_11535 [Pseudoclavibacter chungangensis]NYJ67969.1 hypothetical protein [Pseudoclavibacter chungangensis]
MSVRADRVPPSLARGNPAPGRPRPAPVARRRIPPAERALSLLVFAAAMTGLLAIAIAIVTRLDPVVTYSASSATAETSVGELLITAQVSLSGPSSDRRTEARLVATDLESGSRVWTADPNGRDLPLTVLVASGGLVYAASGDGPVLVDADTGVVRPLEPPPGSTAAPALDVTGSAHDVATGRLLVLADDGEVWQVPLGGRAAEATDTATAAAWRATLAHPLDGTPVPGAGPATDARGRLVASAGCDAPLTVPTPPAAPVVGAAPADDLSGTDGSPVCPGGHAVVVGAAHGIELSPTTDTTPPTVDIARTGDGTVTRITLPGRILAAFDTDDGPGLLLENGAVVVIEAGSGTVRELAID